MRKTKVVVDTKAKKAPAIVIPAEHEPLLKEVHEAVKSMGRTTTSQAFERGFQFARAKAVLPEKMLGRWMSSECGYTPRQGRNYIAIHDNLQDHRARLEQAAVSPTVMFVLASATPEKVQEVLMVIESGERLTVGQVKALTKTIDDKQADMKAVLGGAAGLRRAAEAKMKDEVTFFTQLAKRILKSVEAAADVIASGKNLSKKALAGKVEVDAYKASALLRSVIYPKQVDAEQTGNRMTDDLLPSGWAPVPALFASLGDAPRWPAKEEFPIWVTGTVLPTLRFVVHGDPLPEKPHAAAVDAVGPAGREVLETVPSLDAVDAVVEEPAFSDETTSDVDASDLQTQSEEAATMPSAARTKHAAGV
ncbi:MULTISPECIES: hypothetical protein [Rhizobium/Agrobacterium group]|uniref:hypothetical protein n=1 Tax=Rhizobium oryzihabitans TaxID=2267833 RepID=UPI004033FCB1